MQPLSMRRRPRMAWVTLLAHLWIPLLCPQSVDGITCGLDSARLGHGPLHSQPRTGLSMGDLNAQLSSSGNLFALRPSSVPRESLVIRLRGGARTMKKESASVRGASVKRTSSPANEKKRRKHQPKHNLPPEGWMKKIKNHKRQEIGLKGATKGRKKPVFHFWTKSKIKLYIKKEVAYRVHVRKQKAARPIQNFGRGWKTSEWKWLPSEYELKELEGEKAAEEEIQAHEEREGGGDEGGDDDEEGGGGGGGDEEEEFMFPGMDGDSDEEEA